MARIVVPLGMSEGINLFNAPSDIRDQEMVRCKNLYPPTPGMLGTRPAMMIHAIVGGFQGYAKNLHFLPLGAPAAFALYQDGDASRVYAYDESNTPLASANFGTTTEFTPASIAFNKKLYTFGGTGCDSVGKVLQPLGGGAAEFVNFQFSTSGNEAIRPAVVGVWKNRFVYANFGAGHESSLIVADPFDPALIKANALSANGSYFPVNPDDGDRVTALIEVLLTGQANVQSALLVLKEFSAYLLTGDPLLADGSAPDGSNPPIDTLSVNRMPLNCGGTSPLVVCTTPFGIIWAGPDDIWFFPEGQLPYRVGTKIRPALQNTPAQMRYRWHAAYHEGFYKLAVFAAGSGPDSNSPCGEQYWLDLRSGPPRRWEEARWYGPMVHTFLGEGSVPAYGTFCLAVDTRANSERQLYGAYGDNGVGSAHTLVTFASNTETDCDDYNIDWEILSKNYKTITKGDQVVADAVQEKGLHGIELPCVTGKAGQLAWRWILNDGRTVSAEQLVNMVPPSGFILGTSLLGTGQFSDEDALLALDPAPERAVGRAIQLKLYSKDGFYISEDTIVSFQIEMAPTVFAYALATLPAGAYATALAIATAIATSLTTVSGVTVTASLAGGLIRFTHGGGLGLRFGSVYVGLVGFDSTFRTALQLGFTSSWNTTGYAGVSVTADTEVIASPTPVVAFPDGAALHLYSIPRRIL